MHIGFTGTREGMSPSQHKAVLRLIQTHSQVGKLHHGDCVGADKEAHSIASALKMTTIVHPPTKGIYRAWCPGTIVHPPKSYLARDCDIVESAWWLIAAPLWMDPREGGTWATIKMASREGVPVTVVDRDGEYHRSGNRRARR